MAECITLDGHLAPIDSFVLDRQLDSLTAIRRPHIVVDLRRVEEVHPSVVSVLLRQQRQARRLQGELRVMGPSSPTAAETLHRIGLLETEPC